MRVEFAIAGVAAALLAVGHMVAGRRLLPGLRELQLPKTMFGPPSLSLGMLRFTWNMVTLVLTGFATLFLTLALAAHANLETVLLRWVAVLWLAATITSLWEARRQRLRHMLRFPVPLVIGLVAAMCWAAASSA